LVFGERRIGKSSIGAATIARVRAAGGIGIDLDCSADAIGGPALAAALLQQAREQDAAGEAAFARIREVARGGTSTARRLLRFGTALGIDEAAGIEAVIPASMLDELPDLRAVLAAMVADAVLTRRSLVILLDEVQHLADWRESSAIQEQLAAAMRHADGPSLIFAGSRRRPVEQLFARGRPLYAEGLWFEVPPISDEHWRSGLVERFREGGVTIEDQLVRQLLAITDGQPQDTMRICEHAYEWTVSSGLCVVDAHVLRQAHAEAREHPSWGDR